jgi:transposase
MNKSALRRITLAIALRVPWAHPKSGFTLLFEAFAISLAGHMTMAQVVALLDVKANPFWERLRRVVQAAHDWENYAAVIQKSNSRRRV